MRCLACQGNSNLYDSLAGKEGLQIRRRDKPNCFAVRAWVNLQMHHRFL
jgi:transcriptional regulator NrdR family protein